MALEDIGWNAYFKSVFAEYERDGMIPGRICSHHKNSFEVLCERETYYAKISGKLYHQVKKNKDFPVVGDWVVVTPSDDNGSVSIRKILPRKSRICQNERELQVRSDGLNHEREKVLVANIDVLFLVFGLDHDFNLRRIESYLAVAYNSGSMPVILLNKADKCSDIDEKLTDVESVAFGIPIHVLTAKENKGIDALMSYFKLGVTAAFLGSEGSGRSTIISRLLGDERSDRQALRPSSGRGDLAILSSGGLIIDSFGLRDFKLSSFEMGKRDSFKDIEDLIQLCRFSDCKHISEPGCAVLKAIEEGELSERRLNSYLKLSGEEFLQTREEFHPKGKKYKGFNATEKEKLWNARTMTKKGTKFKE